LSEAATFSSVTHASLRDHRAAFVNHLVCHLFLILLAVWFWFWLRLWF
jgi:hypothetical protein